MKMFFLAWCEVLQEKQTGEDEERWCRRSARFARSFGPSMVRGRLMASCSVVGNQRSSRSSRVMGRPLSRFCTMQKHEVWSRERLE
jgi:hypothetical protein